MDPQVIEGVRDAHLLVDRQRHSLALHSVAERCVISEDHACDGTGTRSSQSA
jgi:hypothetical protein